MYLELRCQLQKCWIDHTTTMELRKCTTQNDEKNPDRFNPCQYLSIKGHEEYEKGEVWKKFGEMIDKSKPPHKDTLQ
jgi:hypothetical protein